MQENDITKIDLSKSKFDQSTYLGRALHFANATNPLNLLLTHDDLVKCRKIVLAHQAGKLQDSISEPEFKALSVEKLYNYKNQYDSAYHPETGKLQPWWGRMSSQVPMNMVITGAMVALSHTPALSLFWQLANQTYNSAVNYTNRSGGEDSGIKNILLAWAIASSTAVGASNIAQKRINNNATLQKLSPAVLRALGPFAGIVAANLINIPVMRNREFIEGIAISNEQGEVLGNSVSLTPEAISKVIVGRLAIAFCCVICPSIMMKFINKMPPVVKLNNSTPAIAKTTDVTLTILSVGACLGFSVPLALAIFPQRCEIGLDKLPEDLKMKILEKDPTITKVYYNKGL